MVDKTTTQLRVTGQKIVPFEYGPSAHLGEAMEVRAAGTWKDEDGQEYPISVHITVPPGSAIPPLHFGDPITVTVGRSY
jgi:hypothetical protein